MTNYNPQTEHLNNTQWLPGQSGNPAGKPKGTKHLSTWIQEIMEDDTFEQKLTDGVIFKGAPVKAIITCLIVKALSNDLKAFDLLAKYGYSVNSASKNSSNQLPQPILWSLNTKKYVDSGDQSHK